MKTLFVCNGFTVNMSGGDYHMIKTASHWAKNNDNVSYLLPKLGYEFVSEQLAGESFVVNTPLESKANGFMNVILLYLLRTVKASIYDLDHDFEVVLSSSHYPFDVIPSFIKRLKNPGSLLVVYFHGLSIPDGKISARLVSTFYNLFGLLIARFADVVFVINSESKALLLKQGVSMEKIVKTSNGVETDNSLDIENATFEACFLGRLVQYKGIFDLLYAWKKVCQVMPNAKLAILGDGPERERIEKAIIELGLEKNIILFGFVFGSEKLRLLKSAKLFLSPSYLETWGISVAEAMSCGLPVITYNLPIYREVFEDYLVTVPIGNVDLLAEKIISLVNDNVLTQRLGSAGKKFVKRYQWDIVAEKERQSIYQFLKNRHSQFSE